MNSAFGDVQMNAAFTRCSNSAFFILLLSIAPAAQAALQNLDPVTFTDPTVITTYRSLEAKRVMAAQAVFNLDRRSNQLIAMPAPQCVTRLAPNVTAVKNAVDAHIAYEAALANELTFFQSQETKVTAATLAVIRKNESIIADQRLDTERDATRQMRTLINYC